MAKNAKVYKSQRGKAAKQRIPAWVWIAAGLVLVAMIATVFALTRPGPSQAVKTSTPAPAANSEQPLEVTVFDALSRRMEGALILDVREPDEWAAGHIPDATHIPLGELESRLDELPKDQEVVVVCRSGNRSATGRDILLENGFSRVSSMAGGMNDWQAEGFPIETGD